MKTGTQTKKARFNHEFIKPLSFASNHLLRMVLPRIGQEQNGNMKTWDAKTSNIIRGGVSNPGQTAMKD